MRFLLAFFVLSSFAFGQEVDEDFKSMVKRRFGTLETRVDLIERDLESLVGDKPGCPCDKGGKCICGESCKCELCLEHLSNIDVVNLYAKHEAEISKIWENLPEEKTMRDAVKIWITQQHAKNNGVEGKPPLRAEYEAEVEALVKLKESLEAQGKDYETIARTLHAARRDIGEKYKNLTPLQLRSEIYERNYTLYGDKLGPSIDWLRGKGKTWRQIAESASDPGDWPPKGMEESSELRRAVVAGASWCGPCQKGNAERDAAGLVEGEDYEYFDVDKSPDLKAKYHVTDLPALILLEGDTVKSHHVGLTGMTRKLQEWICREALPAGAGINQSLNGPASAVLDDSKPNRFSYQMPVMYRPMYYYTEPSFSQRFFGSSCPNCR